MVPDVVAEHNPAEALHLVAILICEADFRKNPGFVEDRLVCNESRDLRTLRDGSVNGGYLMQIRIRTLGLRVRGLAIGFLQIFNMRPTCVDIMHRIAIRAGTVMRRNCFE